MSPRKARPSDDGPTHSGEFIGENLPRREELRLIVDALNGKQLYFPGKREEFGDYERMLRETPPLLRNIVESWQSCKEPVFRLEEFFEKHPETRTDVQRYWETLPTMLVGAELGGGAAIALCPLPGRTPYEEALRFFVWLITNPVCDKLAGPCARCGNYYIRGSAANKLYCSRSCGTRATALAATRKRRDEDRADKLRRAAEEIRKWELKPPTKKEGYWKAVVSKRGDISVKFLTRAVNNGELKPPTKGTKP